MFRTDIYNVCFRMKYTEKHDPDHVLLDNHSVAAGDGCCIKFLPEGAHSAAASARTTVDDALRAQIETKLSTPPVPRAIAVCRICKDLTGRTPEEARNNLFCIRLPMQADVIVWHLRSWCVFFSEGVFMRVDLG